MLTELAKHHEDWLRSVRRTGELTYAEDIVQEMYLRVHKYCRESQVLVKGEVKKNFIYFILWNMTKDFFKQKSKIDKFSLGEGFDLEESEEFDFGYGKFLERLDNEMSEWHWHDRKIYRLYVGTYGTTNIKTFGKGMSLRTFAKESKIPMNDIRITILRCKQKIKDNLGEDWLDYINNDWERI